MNRCLVTIIAGFLSGSVMAADCTVSGNTVSCAPGETYNSAQHNGKALHEYEQVSLHRTDSEEHGYVQFSGQYVFQDVFIIVEGSRGDGVRLRNWGPTVDFNNLTVQASGFSGDGINLGRDNSAGRVRVHENAVIDSTQGMGVRSVASEYDDGKHIITFNGSSTITTHSRGSNDAGHAVFAGTQSKGCGPFGLPLYDCKADGAAEVHLLGGHGNLHAITTHGEGAHGIYATGKGQVIADNIQIETHADGAHGIAVDRIRGSYYHGSNDTGNQDDAANVELRGNVAITVHGDDAYAFYVDSASAQSGLDSEGNIALIRSFDSSTGAVVADKTYLINGNMLATRSGIIDLAMGEGSQFTGTTLAEENGVLHLQLAGESSAWHMTGDSVLSSLTLNAGASLIPTHGSTTPASQSISGRVVNNGGVIDLTASRLIGDTLIIDGDYDSAQGRIIFSTLLSDDDSPVDKLVITGDSSGEGIVHIADQGGTGAATTNGIQLINIHGRSDANFSLAEDYVHNGEKAVVVGAYAYKLRKGDKAGLNDEHWYLQSDANSSTEPPIQPPVQPKPNYNAGTPMYEVYPQLLLTLNTLPTLQQRLGERALSLGSIRAGAAVRNLALADSGTSSSTGAVKEGPWVRLMTAHNKVKPRISTTDSSFKYDTFGMQLGFDKQVYQAESAQVFGGLSLLYGHGKANVYSTHSDGDIKTDSYGVAGSLTWYGSNGVYIDAQAQKSWFKSNLYSSLGQKNLTRSKNRGHGYAFSLEAGKPYAINEAWSIIPQAQLQYNNVKFDSFHTQWRSSRPTVSHDKSKSIVGRVGVSVNYRKDSGQGEQADLYGIFNLYNEFGGKTKVQVADTQFTNQRERLTGSIGVGGVYSWQNGKYAVYGEGSVNSSFKHISANRGYQATLGFRVMW